MPLPWMPLVAAGLDWLEGLLPLVFVLVWIVSQVWGVFRRIGGDGKAKPPPAGRRPAPRPVPKAPWLEEGLEEELPRDDADLRRELQEQIEGFLRETGRKSHPESPVRSAAPSRKSRPTVRSRPALPSAPQPPATGSGGRGRGERTVGEFADRASDIARHVEDAFADDLVHRKALAPVVIEPPPAVAPVDLVAALRNPAALRQLIIVREVLDRPTGRW